MVVAKQLVFIGNAFSSLHCFMFIFLENTAVNYHVVHLAFIEQHAAAFVYFKNYSWG